MRPGSNCLIPSQVSGTAAALGPERARDWKGYTKVTWKIDDIDIIFSEMNVTFFNNYLLLFL